MNVRRYEGETDVALLQAFNAAAIAETDGTLAAFTVTWHDHLNRTGLFEPVGTHPGHRRRGLGKALLLFAMKAMAAEGMEYATVVNEGANEASRALYASVGFSPWHLLDGYTKPMERTGFTAESPCP
ncbi:MAG: GNAT family N-acetyltransferase [Actinomycetia bacterium]|nr:GNAT family N-acetyltransferase [Actinomycetes bacterium]